MRNLISIFLFSIGFMLLVLINHILPFNNSLINFKSEKLNIEKTCVSEEKINTIIEYHQTNVAFAKRPLSTLLIEKLSNITANSQAYLFVIVNFSLLLFCGIVLFYLAQLITKNKTYSFASVGVFYLSYSVLFAFYDTIYTYDEPLQYLLILYSLIALLNQKWVIFILSFTLSLISRETGLLLLPGLVILLQPKVALFFTKRNVKHIAYLLIPIILYFSFLILYTHYTQIFETTKSDFTTRLNYFKYNFQNQNFSFESIISLFLAIGIHLYIIVIHYVKNEFSATEKQFIKAFLVTFFINTIIVLLTSKARETRLFSLPLVFLWPILGKFLLIEWKNFIGKIQSLSIFKNKWFILLMSLFLFLEILIYKFVFIPTENAKGGNFQDEYFLFLLFTITIHAFIQIIHVKSTRFIS